jgi:predicted Fe-S protein YdhL (DUF1289 family)
MSVKSPCVDICKFDKRTGFCTACARTKDEARGWKKMTDHKRHAILADTPRRLKKLQPPPG